MTANDFNEFDDFLFEMENELSFSEAKRPSAPRSRSGPSRSAPGRAPTSAQRKSSGRSPGRAPRSSGAKSQSSRRTTASSANDTRRNSRNSPPPPRRTPPPRRRRSGCFNPFSYIIFVVAISLILSTLIWTAANDLLALNKEEGTATIVIEENDTIHSVAKQLKDMGVIRRAHLFKVYGRHTDAIEKIIPGTYELRTDLDYRAIVSAMSYSAANRKEVTVTIPEGYTLEQIFQLLAEKKVCTYDELVETAATHDYAFSFLEDIPLGDAHRLEGYLYPDTYNFYEDQSALYAINKMLVNFDAKVKEEMRQKAHDMGYSLHDVIIIASIIERETTGLDQAIIASVIYNRLNSTSYPYLQIDATVRYAMNDWTTPLTYDNLKLDSPYNTYAYPGLPAGPIANPGYAAINAALNPASTSYYFYALASDGSHRFFQSQDSFDSFVSSQGAG